MEMRQMLRRGLGLGNTPSNCYRSSQIQNSSRFNRDKIQNLLRIEDRKEAIETAIKMARKGDFVIITGKSHEKSMNYGHEIGRAHV